MILTLKGKLTAAILFAESCPKGFPADLFRGAKRKLHMLSIAHELDDLRSPPGNRLEALAGDRGGQHSIRINDQWRICFRSTPQGAADAEVVDYH